MTLSPTHASCLARWLRLVAAWLVCILVMQGLQGAMALGAGPRHLHRPATAQSPAHTHAHLGFERHHHALTDGSVQVVDPAGTGAVDAAAAALALALSLMAFGAGTRTTPAGRHVLRPARSWFWRSIDSPPLLRPPRLVCTR